MSIVSSVTTLHQNTSNTISLAAVEPVLALEMAASSYSMDNFYAAFSFPYAHNVSLSTCDAVILRTKLTFYGTAPTHTFVNNMQGNSSFTLANYTWNSIPVNKV